MSDKCWKDRRFECTGKSFGKYFRVWIVRGDGAHQLYVYADKITIEDAHLCLYKGGEIYRSFAPGVWKEFASSSCATGSEMYEDHDYVLVEDKAS